jgi:hypothetical protein
MISEKLPAVRNWSVRSEKNALARIRAASGPRVEPLSSRRHSGGEATPYASSPGAMTGAGPDGPGRPAVRQPQQLARPNAVSFASTPVTGLSVIRVTPVSVYPVALLPALA